jgi:hypothetical protein
MPALKASGATAARTAVSDFPVDCVVATPTLHGIARVEL